MRAADGSTVQPIVVAHRALSSGPAGGERSGVAAENTAAAVRAAIDAGADAVELDVRMTRDRQLVLSHDALRWHGRRWRRRPYLIRRCRSRTVAFLPDPGEAVEAALAAGIAVKLDIKDAAALTPTAQWCRARELDLSRIALWCRSAAAIGGLADRTGFGELALLSDGATVDVYLARAHACDATAVSLDPGDLSAQAVSTAHQNGLVIYAWIRDPRQHRVALDLGVDGLVTDWVGAAIDSRAGRN